MDEITSFFVGIGIGVIGFALLMTILGTNPTQTQRKMENTAVSLGHGKWVMIVSSNKTYKPSTQFEWITNETVNIKK